MTPTTSRLRTVDMCTICARLPRILSSYHTLVCAQACSTERACKPIRTTTSRSRTVDMRPVTPDTILRSYPSMRTGPAGTKKNLSRSSCVSKKELRAQCLKPVGGATINPEARTYLAESDAAFDQFPKHILLFLVHCDHPIRQYSGRTKLLKLWDGQGLGIGRRGCYIQFCERHQSFQVVW